MTGPLAVGTRRGGVVDAQYVTLAVDAVLTDERVLTAGAGITLVDGGAGGAVTLSVTNLYLRLDCSNDPLTAGLEINAATAGEPVLILQTTDDDPTNNIQEWQASDDEVRAYVDSVGRICSNLGTPVSNFIMGPGAGNAAITGQFNLFLGNSAGAAHTTGDLNVYIGESSGAASLGAQQNVGLGALTLEAITSGSQNVAIGYLAGNDITTGSYNVFIGKGAGEKMNTGNGYNIAIGMQAGDSMIGGAIRNVLIGPYAGETLTTHDGNVMIGFYAGVGCTGSNNVYIGDYVASTGFAESNRLRIESSNAIIPLIYGEFDNDLVRLYADTAITNAVHDVLYLAHVTSGGAAAGFGVGLVGQLEDDGGTLRDASNIDTVWDDATAAGYKGRLVLSAVDSNGTREGMRIEGSGAAAEIGFFGHAAVNQRQKANFNNWAAFTDVVDALVSLGLFDAA